MGAVFIGEADEPAGAVVFVVERMAERVDPALQVATRMQLVAGLGAAGVGVGDQAAQRIEAVMLVGAVGLADPV